MFAESAAFSSSQLLFLEHLLYAKQSNLVPASEPPEEAHQYTPRTQLPFLGDKNRTQEVEPSDAGMQNLRMHSELGGASGTNSGVTRHPHLPGTFHFLILNVLSLVSLS